MTWRDLVLFMINPSMEHRIGVWGYIAFLCVQDIIHGKYGTIWDQRHCHCLSILRDGSASEVIADDEDEIGPAGDGDGGEDGCEVEDWSVSCLVPVMQGEGKLTRAPPPGGAIWWSWHTIESKINIPMDGDRIILLLHDCDLSDCSLTGSGSGSDCGSAPGRRRGILVCCHWILPSSLQRAIQKTRINFVFYNFKVE